MDKKGNKKEKIQSFNQFVNEFKTASLTKSIAVDVVIELSDHALERQKRTQTVVVTQEDILKTIDQAVNRIIKYLLIGKLSITQRVLIKDHTTDLNVVIALKRQSSSLALRIEVLTVMKTKDFRNSGKTYIIDLNNGFIPPYTTTN